MQAATVLSKMACYTIGPLFVVDLVFSMGKVALMWGDQAGLDLLVADGRILELFPVSLALAASCGLLLEVEHSPFTACLMLYPAYWRTGLSYDRPVHTNKLCNLSKVERCVCNPCTGTITPWCICLLPKNRLALTWAARYNSWLLTTLTPKGIVFSFFSFLFLSYLFFSFLFLSLL